MDRIYVFLIRNDIWIYILSGIGLVWYLTEYWRSRRILRSAIFGLEKEKGQRIRTRAIALVVLFIGIIAAVTYVNLSISPTLAPELLKPPTPTPNIFATPLSPPTPLTAQETVTIAAAPTVTLPGALIDESTPVDESAVINGEATGTPFPELSPGDCSPEVNISSPPNGTAVSNSVTLFGTATGGQFGLFMLEVLGPESEAEWLPVSEARLEPVLDGILGTISFDNRPPGSYHVRLLAFDEAGTETGQCTIELLLGSDPS